MLLTIKGRLSFGIFLHIDEDELPGENITAVHEEAQEILTPSLQQQL